MKYCNHCHAQLDDQASVCGYCGTPVQANPYAAPAAYQAPYAPAPKEAISVGGWIGRSLIPLIPLVGGLIYFIMLFVWSGDSNKEDTFRNWAKAQLIVMAIGVVLCILLFVLVAAMGYSMY